MRASGKAIHDRRRDGYRDGRMPDLVDEVRAHAAAIAENARSVRIDLGVLGALTPVEPPPFEHPGGSEEDVARFVLISDAINFGSGWFPTLNKRRKPDGRPMSGTKTVLAGLTDRFTAHGPWTNAELRTLHADELAGVLGQPADHELMALYAQALRQLGTWLGDRRALDVAAGPSAVHVATELSALSMWADRGFYKRAQITASDLAAAGVATFADLDRLTIFADNLVPHVLRCAGVLVYTEPLATAIDEERLLPPGPWEQEIRGCAVHACELLSRRTGIAPRILDYAFWNLGQDAEIKARPRHRCRSVYY